MSISSVSGSSAWTKIQQFQTGKSKLQKEDLQQLQQLQQQQSEQTAQTASPFDELLAAFDDIDQDQDGISLDELQSYAAQNGMPEGAKKGPPPGPPPSMAGELGGAQMGGKAPPPPSEMPQSVSKDELMQVQADMESQGMDVPEKLTQMISDFDSLDTDKDGKVSIEEMMAAEQQESESSEESSQPAKLDFLKLIEKLASEDSESTAKTTDESKDMAIQFMRAINQYTNFASYSSQNSGMSLFEADA